MPDKNSHTDDIRMSGFRERSRVETVLAWIDVQAARLPVEAVSPGAAHGRVLGTDVIARYDVPSFARSAMDGYALRGAETVGAGDYNPLPFHLAGEVLPGRPLDREIPPGSAARIMTGAPLPPGADAVLPAEFARESGAQVEAMAAVPPGKNVGPRGEDVRAGATVLHEGRRLRPQDVGLLASVGISEIPVVRRPRVRIIATGNELVPPGVEPAKSQIVDSNSEMLSGLVRRDGGEIVAAELIGDDRGTIAARLTAGDADVILVSGGSSVGAEDYAPQLVAELGTLAVHGVAMRPSSPAGAGRIGKALVFLLPGNPVSCLCAYDFFAGRAIRLCGGRSPDWPYTSHVAPVGRKIVSAVGRVDYTRVRLVAGSVEPVATSGASILSSTTAADGFVVVPAELEGYPPGASVTVYLYDPPG